MKTRLGILRTLLIAGFWMTACGSQALDVQPTPSPQATQPPVEVSRLAQATLTPDVESPATAQTCTVASDIKRYKLDSKLMNGDLYVTVYFPPCYDPQRSPGYPVLYLLHGQTFDDGMWLDLGANQIADELITSGQSQPFLMVMPFEEFYYRQPDTTKFPQAFTDEVIPFIDTTFDVCTERACRALGGISRGASWALRLGLQDWDLFASMGAHSLPTFKGDLDKLPDWLAEIPKDSAPRIYIDIGRFDPEVKTAYSVEHVLNEKGILNEWHLNDGRHNTEYWSAHIREYMQWYAQGWDLIAPSAQTAQTDQP
jgi:enterochelin esterase-like enzyme